MSESTESTIAHPWNSGSETRTYRAISDLIQHLDTGHPIRYCFDASGWTGSNLVKSAVAGALSARLISLSNTPGSRRWPNADWPHPRAFADAMVFVEALPQKSIPLPNVGLADDGEVNFLWDSSDIHVDLGFYGDGCFSYYARDSSGQAIHGDDIPARAGLPDALLEILCG